MITEFWFGSILADIGILDDIETHSLEPHENVIYAYVTENDAAMIYWLHQQKIWDYLLGCDQEIINEQMNNLVNQIKAGNIVHVRKGLLVDVKGTQLYPVEFESKLL